ncbi:MAG: hypothetical protein ACXWCS_04695 [Burkholderiales bacterium]
MAATILKAVMAGKLRRARMAERKVAIHKGAMGDQRVDRANKGMASNAVMAAKAGKRRTDRRVTSKQHKVVTHHKVDTDRKVDMALGPILVAKVGSKWEAGAPSKVTLPKRANRPEATADKAVGSNQDLAGTAAKAAAMGPRPATARMAATVLKADKDRPVVGVRKLGQAAGFSRVGRSKAARNAAGQKAINDPTSGSRKTSAST